MLNSETLIQYNQRTYHSLVDGMTILNMLGSDIIVGKLESTVDRTTSNDEFFDAFVDSEPVATVDCHYDADEGQRHFFDCEELEQELFDPSDVQSICVKRTVVDCVYETCDDHLANLFHHQSEVHEAENEALSINGPTTTSFDAFHRACAFMTFAPDPSKKPIIFDTGASLAITPDITDFNGPLSVPSGNLRLGGMANGLKIAAIGMVTWTFTNPDGSEIQIKGQAYHVPGAKA